MRTVELQVHFHYEENNTYTKNYRTTKMMWLS